MTHVLANLTHGGWGKKDFTTRCAGMTTLKRGEGSTTSTTKDIAAAATQYYGGFFAPTTTDDDARHCGCADNLTHFIAQQFDPWEHEMAITVGSKTTGRDRIAT